MTWLLDLTWAGRVFRFASEPVTPLDAQGVPLPYAGGLVPRYEIGADVGQVQRDLEVDLGELLFPVDVARWHREGRPLLGALGELSTWTAGDTHESRVVRVTGSVSLAEFGADGEPVTLALRWDSGGDGASIVPPQATVTTTTLPDADDGARGKTYPLVVGMPGLGETSSPMIPVSGGAPAFVSDATVANGQILLSLGAVAATTVTVLNVTDAAWETRTVATGADDTGRTISVTDGSVGEPYAAGDVLWVDWSSSSGGILRVDGTGAIDTASHWIAWLVSLSTAEIDAAAWTRLPIDGYRLAGYIDDPSVSPLEFLERQILPLLPLSAVPGPRGLRPVLWRFDARDTDAVIDLVDGENCSRVSSLAIDVGSVRNSITVMYAPRASDGEMARSVTLDEDTHPGCAASRTYLPARAETIESVILYDTATAWRVAGWRAAAFSLPVEAVSYEADADLAVGDVVTITDSGLHLSARVAVVATVAYDGPTTTVRLVMFTIPGRDSLRA